MVRIRSIRKPTRARQKGQKKLNLPQNSTIKYGIVKCCKDCKHNTHYYYHAYFRDCDSKQLKKNI